MLNKEKIIEFLENEGFDEIDEIQYKNDILVFNLFYSYDDAEIDAAKDFANENYSEENGEDEWYNEYFLPYLIDIASDNVRDILSDLCEEFNLEGEFVAYELDRDNYEQCEFTIILAEQGTDIDVDKILKEINS
jgi:hypothetical protein